MEVTLDSLTDQLRAASTDVSNVTSQFLCLSNTQFLENRVYEDDDDDDDDGKEIPSQEKKDEVKVRSVKLHCSGLHQLVSYGNTLSLSLHQGFMKTEEKKLLEVNDLHVCA
jgi:hypothetical protein